MALMTTAPSLWGAGIFIWLALPINSLNSHRLLQMQVLKTWKGKCKLLCSIEITFQRHEIWMQKGLVQRSVMKIFRNRLNLLLIYFYLSVYSGTLNWCYGDSVYSGTLNWCYVRYQNKTFLFYTWTLLLLKSSSLSLIYSQSSILIATWQCPWAFFVTS